MYAYLDEDNTVRELIAMTRQDLEYYYPPDFVARCVECGEEVQQGWVYDGKAFAPPPGPTPEEIEAQEKAHALTESATLITARMQRQIAQTEPFTETEFGLFAKAGLYDAWKPGETYHAGFRLVHEGIVYTTMQQVVALEHQPPGSTGMLSVYRPISTDPEGGDPTGAVDDPIPFIYGMDVANGLHYSWEECTYLAKSDMPACIWYPGTSGLWQWELVA